MQKPVTEKKKYFVVRERAVPEVLLKVVEAKKLLDSGKVDTVQDAAERTGISRSSFYKYKDDIFPFHEETRGKTITFIIQMDDEPGLLSVVLQTIARFHGNILTIHQILGRHQKHLKTGGQVLVQFRIQHIRHFITAYHNAIVQTVRLTDRLRSGAADTGDTDSVSHQNVFDIFGVIQSRQHYNNIRHLPTSFALSLQETPALKQRSSSNIYTDIPQSPTRKPGSGTDTIPLSWQ